MQESKNLNQRSMDNRDPWFEAMDNTTPVFVYGTLMKGNSTRGLNMFPGAKFKGTAQTKKSSYSLYDLGSFPAVGPKGRNSIQGEVWEVDDETFRQLDRIEGYPEFYSRQQIDTTQGKAWMYYIPDIAEYDSVYQIKGDGTVAWQASY
jgi:gamma-glutamylcyclotransferase (GGCT)/AIG2-like uncharacterized protein YtfP